MKPPGKSHAVYVSAATQATLMRAAYERCGPGESIEGVMAGIVEEALRMWQAVQADTSPLVAAVNAACEARIAFDLVLVRRPEFSAAADHARTAWCSARDALIDAIREESSRTPSVVKARELGRRGYP